MTEKTERTDHAAEARNYIACWEEKAGQYAEPDMALLQAHATLALVEQQRIANLIALATDATDRFGNYAGNGGIFSRIYDNPPTESGNVSVKPDIAAALGIQEEQS